MVTSVSIGGGLFSPAVLGYSRTAENVADSTARLAGGKRILRTSDDAASVSIAARLQTQIFEYRQSGRDVATSDTLVEVAKEGLKDIQAKLEKALELAEQADTDTLIERDRALLQQQFAEALAEVDRLVEKTTFKEQKLLDGSFADKDIRVGPEEGDIVTIAISDVGTDELFGATPPDLSTELKAAAAKEAVTEALETVGAQIGALNGVQGQLFAASENISSTLSGVSQAESELTDTDAEAELRTLTEEQIKLDIGSAVIAQASRISNQLLNVLDFKIEFDKQAEVNEAEDEAEVAEEQTSTSAGINDVDSEAAA